MTEEEKKVLKQDDDNLDPDEFDEDEEQSEESDNPEDENSDKSDDSNPQKSEEELEKERRAEQARKRREREANEKAERERQAREEQIRKEAETNAKLGVITVNPWTNKPIRDKQDLEIYEIMKQLDESGKDPLSDLPEALAQRARDSAAASKKAEEDAKLVQDNLKKEISDLRKKYPKVNTKELADDPLYEEIAEEKGGRWTVLEIYEEYLHRKGDAKKGEDNSDEDKRIKEIAKGNKQTSSNGGSSNKGGEKKVEDMTDEEFRSYYRKKYHR